MFIRVQAISDIGCLRSNNEDHILLVREIFTNGSRVVDFELEEKLVFAVADGMGGHNAGEVASEMVLQSLAGFFIKQNPEVVFDDFEINIKRWVDDIHAVLINAGNKDASLKGMGTTLTGIFFGSAGTFAFNAGDSRIYYFQDGKFQQISQDHTLSEVSGMPGIKSNLLVNCIGAVPESYVNVFDLSYLVASGVTFLICSDGLSDMVADTIISKFLNPLRMEELVTEAKRLGGRDNISVIGVEIG
jgi:PPM family protein phosphatase